MEFRFHHQNRVGEWMAIALVGCRRSFDRFSFPRSSVGMPSSRSSGTSPKATRDAGASGPTPTLERESQALPIRIYALIH